MTKEGDLSHSNGKSSYLVTEPTSPYYLHPSSSPGTALTQIKLRGENYSSWEQTVVILALKSQNKIGFIDGTIVKPATSAPEYGAWEIVNSMLCSWIANSLDDSIRATVSRLTNVKVMWDCLRTRYSVQNGPRIYKLWSDLAVTKQSGATVMSYYTKFLGMWEDLVTLSPLEACDCEGGAKVAAWFDNLKTYQFLMGLDDVYGPLRTQIINVDPLPGLDRAYAMVTQEESHRTATRSRDDAPAVGFAVQSLGATGRGGSTHLQSSSSSPASGSSAQPTQNGRPFCTYCQRQGHGYDRCWIRLGISPAQGRGRGRGRGRGHSQSSQNTSIGQATAAAVQTSQQVPTTVAPSSPMIPGLSNEQVQRLLALIEPSPSSVHLSGPHHDEPDWPG